MKDTRTSDRSRPLKQLIFWLIALVVGGSICYILERAIEINSLNPVSRANDNAQISGAQTKTSASTITQTPMITQSHIETQSETSTPTGTPYLSLTLTETITPTITLVPTKTKVP
jgi:hypothetical protein